MVAVDFTPGIKQSQEKYHADTAEPSFSPAASFHGAAIVTSSHALMLNIANDISFTIQVASFTEDIKYACRHRCSPIFSSAMRELVIDSIIVCGRAFGHYGPASLDVSSKYASSLLNNSRVSRAIHYHSKDALALAWAEDIWHTARIIRNYIPHVLAHETESSAILYYLEIILWSVVTLRYFIAEI